jgi:hypothetical protein
MPLRSAFMPAARMALLGFILIMVMAILEVITFEALFP